MVGFKIVFLSLMFAVLFQCNKNGFIYFTCKFFGLPLWDKMIPTMSLEKSEEPEESNLPIVRIDNFSVGSWRKQGNSRKTSPPLAMLKPWTVWIITNCGKFLRSWGYQTTLPVSWETCIWVKKQQKLRWNDWLVQNWERNMSRLYIVTLFVQLVCRVHHAKYQAEWITSWNQDFREKYQQP